MKKKLPLVVIFVLTALVVNVSFPYIQKALAEQSGSSPESGSTSRLKTISDALIVLGYGSTATGAWGDWGTMWNRIYSSAINAVNDFAVNPEKNGTGAGSANCTSVFALNCYTQAKGGVDDYNAGGAIPTDTYKKTWTTCSASSYCGTGRAVAEKQDPNTMLVWSPRIYDGAGSYDWFWANNCKYPNGLPGDDGVCGTTGEIACYCVKHTGVGGDTKTGCEAYDDGNWRLPYQKELMQSYIDGSWGNLTNAGNLYWSSTTFSTSTQTAWSTLQYNGTTYYFTKVTTTTSVRCVR